MAHRKRSVQLHFMVTEHERELIRQKMEQLGTNNLGAYLRKMAIDGYIVKLDRRSFRSFCPSCGEPATTSTRWPAGASDRECLRHGFGGYTQKTGGTLGRGE